MSDHAAEIAFAVNLLSERAYATAASKGFHDTPNPVPQSLCLIHSEISEALEAYRDDDILTRFTETGKPEGLFVELADALIRILDTAQALGPGELALALFWKMAYNKERPVGHGRVRL